MVLVFSTFIAIYQLVFCLNKSKFKIIYLAFVVVPRSDNCSYFLLAFQLCTVLRRIRNNENLQKVVDVPSHTFQAKFLDCQFEILFSAFFLERVSVRWWSSSAPSKASIVENLCRGWDVLFHTFPTKFLIFLNF